MSAPGRILFCVACLLLATPITRAQDRTLQLGGAVEGELAPGETHRYALTALELTLLSMRVEALNESLDPLLQIFDPAGKLVIANDDYAYPETRDAAIQAFVMPRTATYTIAVSAFGESEGAYRLHALPGYDRLALRESPVDSANWEIVYSDTTVNVSDSSVFALEMRGFARSAGLVGLHLPIEADLYFEAAFDQVSSPVVWQAGLLFRYLSPTQYHRLLLNKNGYWRVDRVDGDAVTQLRGWSGHPAIRPGERAFRLGVLISGGHFDVLYNGQDVGSVADPSPSTAGSLGIAVVTDERVGGALSLVVAETLVTLPTRVENRRLFPQTLITRRSYAMADALARQGLVPVGGEIKLAVPESSARRLSAGVSRFPIASNSTFAQFALGASLRLNAGAEKNGGCGLFFHYNDDEQYTLAYLTSHGDYGVSRRVGAGFEPGLYGNRGPLAGNAHYLLVIVTDDVIHYFVDERYAGKLASVPRIGGIGIAAVNYEDAETGCEFDDLWLLSLDE